MSQTVKAVRIHQTGGPEVMQWEDVEIGEPEAGEVLLRHNVAGLNFIDINHRAGSYPLPSLPAESGSSLLRALRRPECAASYEPLRSPPRQRTNCPRLARARTA